MFMGIKHELPSLIGLVAIQAPIDLPLSMVTGDLFDAYNAGDSRIHIRVADKVDG